MPMPKQLTTPPVPKCVPPKDYWTPIDSMYPPDGNKDYLVTLINPDKHECVIFVAFFDGVLWYVGGLLEGWEVTAWMPLPEPYMPEEETT